MADERPRGLLDITDEPAPRGLLGVQRADFLPLARDRATGEIHFDPQAGLLGEVIRAFRAPGDALMGRLDPFSADGMSRASALAGLLTGGGLLTATRRRGLGMGGGRTASAGRSSRFRLDFFGDSIDILQNPSPKQLEGFLKRSKFKAARRIVDPDTGDVFVWDAGDPALHKMVAEQLGVRPDPRTFDIIGLD